MVNYRIIYFVVSLMPYLKNSGPDDLTLNTASTMALLPTVIEKLSFGSGILALILFLSGSMFTVWPNQTSRIIARLISIMPMLNMAFQFVWFLVVEMKGGHLLSLVNDFEEIDARAHITLPYLSNSGLMRLTPPRCPLSTPLRGCSWGFSWSSVSSWRPPSCPNVRCH